MSSLRSDKSNSSPPIRGEVFSDKFLIKSIKTIAQDRQKYLSFPDIIMDKDNPNTFYVVYRKGDSHHPTKSSLVIKKSLNQGDTWLKLQEIHLNMDPHNWVWNCPRLSYLPNGKLVIICDAKNNINEKHSDFMVLMLDINATNRIITEMKGMVPDKIISYNGDLFCANHKISKDKQSIYQLVNRSKDNGYTWDDCNIIARHPDYDFCEASLVNYQNKYLLAYIRDNKLVRVDETNDAKTYVSRTFLACNNPIQKYISFDGYLWNPVGELSCKGHRVTAIIDKDRVFGSFRNTETCRLSVFTEIIDNKGYSSTIDIQNIEEEQVKNMYNFGYSGLVKYNEDSFMLVYYIQQDEPMPVIRICKFKWSQ